MSPLARDVAAALALAALAWLTLAAFATVI